MVRKSNVKIVGLKSTSKAMSLMIKELIPDSANALLPKLKKAETKMKSRIKPWSFSGQLINSFVITEKTSKKGSKLELKNIAPYASALEGGVREHWVSMGRSNKLDSWMRSKNIKYYKAKSGDLLARIGNPAGESRIKKRGSERAFFGPVIREMTDAGEFDKAIKTGLRDTLNNFERRAGRRDTIILK